MLPRSLGDSHLDVTEEEEFQVHPWGRQIARGRTAFRTGAFTLWSWVLASTYRHSLLGAPCSSRVNLEPVPVVAVWLRTAVLDPRVAVKSISFWAVLCSEQPLELCLLRSCSGDTSMGAVS